jgi:hypothetical protein
MKRFTIRGITDEVEAIVRKESRTKRVSLNRAFVSFLERAVGLENKEERSSHHELDHLCGIWNEQDTEAFDGFLEIQRKVDE